MPKVVEDEEFKPLDIFTCMNCFSFLSDCTWIPPRFDASAGYQVFWQGSNFGWYQWPAIKKTPPQRGIWSIKMPIMEFLERFSIFSGFFVFVVRAGTWCPRLNVWGYDSSIPACRASFTFIQAIPFTVWWPTVGHTWPGPACPCRHLHLQMSRRLSFTYCIGDFGCLSHKTAYLIHFIHSIMVEGDLGGWVPHPLVSFTSYSQWSTPYIWIIHFCDSSISIHHILSISQDHSLFWKYLGIYHIFEASWLCTDHRSGKSMHTLLSHSLMAMQHRIGGKRRYLLYKPCHLSVTSFSCSTSCSSWSSSVSLSSVLHKPIHFSLLWP